MEGKLQPESGDGKRRDEQAAEPQPRDAAAGRASAEDAEAVAPDAEAVAPDAEAAARASLPSTRDAAGAMLPPAELRVPFRIDDTLYETCLTRKFRERRRYEPRDPRRILAQIPGLIVEVAVAPGQTLERHQPLLVLEAMKMRNDVLAIDGGIVKAVHVVPGQTVAKGDLLVEMG